MTSRLVRSVLVSESAKARHALGDPHSQAGGGLANCHVRHELVETARQSLLFTTSSLSLTHPSAHTHTHIATPQASPDHHLLGAIIGWDRGCIVETLGRGLTVRSSPALVLKGLSTQEQKDSERKRKREGGDTSKRAQDSQGCVW